MAGIIKTTVYTIPTRAYSGVIAMPPTSVVAGAISISVTIDVSQMLDTATSFTMDFSVSYDNGQTWTPWAGGTRLGGPLLVDRNGPVTTCALGGPLPQPADANTMLQGTVTIVGTITIGGTIAVS